jgi:DUF1365 family protein
MIEPGLYECTVLHRRLAPKRHEFVYRIFLFLLDLDALPETSARVPIFSADEPNVYSLRRDDYFRFQSGTIRSNVELFLQSRGIDARPQRMWLLTSPRLLGYTFNPISIFFCEGGDGLPQAAVLQVGNTFGEFKPYLVPFCAEGGGWAVRVPKDFYVSPFSDLDESFDIRIAMPGERLSLGIDQYKNGGKILVSALSGRRRPLSSGSLLWMSAKYPLVTARIIFLIHWEALRLWWKGLPFRLKESDPSRQVNAFRNTPR